MDFCRFKFFRGFSFFRCILWGFLKSRTFVFFFDIEVVGGFSVCRWRVLGWWGFKINFI